MARYKIEISRTAEKQLKKLSKDDQKRVVAVILDLAENPLHKGSSSPATKTFTESVWGTFAFFTAAPPGR